MSGGLVLTIESIEAILSGARDGGGICLFAECNGKNVGLVFLSVH
jgi:hypothetical protein